MGKTTPKSALLNHLDSRSDGMEYFRAKYPIFVLDGDK
jgi:hypothetical protein